MTLATRSVADDGTFVILKTDDGSEVRGFVAGTADARAGVLVIHDNLGNSDSTRQAVGPLGSLGYRTLAVDLFKGKSAPPRKRR
jgi:dienelactone hydrolase